MSKKIVVICGPTASGKTALSIALSKAFDGEVVSADSMQIYCELEKGTAKPTPEEQRKVPHHLVDILSMTERSDVFSIVQKIENAVCSIRNRGALPVVAGGTGLYFRVLLENYDLPRVEANPELRAELDLREKEDLLSELLSLDPVGYEKVKNANKRRIVRALEVTKTLGKPFSEASCEKEPEFDVEWKMPVINSREELYDRINRRVDLMVEQGVIEETQNLLSTMGFVLSKAILFDVIIMYCIKKKIYDVFEIDSILFKYDQRTLFSAE